MTPRIRRPLSVFLATAALLLPLHTATAPASAVPPPRPADVNPADCPHGADNTIVRAFSYIQPSGVRHSVNLRCWALAHIDTNHGQAGTLIDPQEIAACTTRIATPAQPSTVVVQPDGRYRYERPVNGCTWRVVIDPGPSSHDVITLFSTSVPYRTYLPFNLC
ncbi:hypothetical protein [Streptomyces sp. NPDC002403]